jgi:hypothetical protein
LTAPQSQLPERNLTACTRSEDDANSLGTGPLYPQQTDLLPLEPRGNLRWHQASLAPRGSAAWLAGQVALTPVEQTRELCSFVFRSAGAEGPSRTERPYAAGPRGSSGHHQIGVPANQQARRTGPIGREPPQGGVR